MDQRDIDKILEDIKKRKRQSEQSRVAAVSAEIKSDKGDTEIKIPVQPVEKPKPAEKPNVEKEVIERDKKVLSGFLNGDDDGDFAAHTAKKSEDYIDENFKNFFTQSVIVTKTPEQTSNVEIKRKKGFFKRKYVTDSLSLKTPVQDEESTKPKIVKKAEPKPAKKAEVPKETSPKPAEEMEDKIQAEKSAVSHTEEKHTLPDADSLARSILEKRQNTPKKEKANPKEDDIISAAEDKKVSSGYEEKTNIPTDDGDIVNSIYNSVLREEPKPEEPTEAENQPKNRPATEETGFINLEPTEEYPEKDEKPGDKVKIFRPEYEDEEEEVFEPYIVNSEFFNKADSESRDIVGELMDFRKTLNFRMVLGLVCGIILGYFGLRSQNSLPMPAFIAPDAQPFMFYIACVAVYLPAFIGFLPTIISGFTSIKGNPAPDTFISLGGVLSLLQLVLGVVFPTGLNIGGMTVFASAMCIAMAFNAMGKKINTSTIIKNLSLANVPDGINAGYIIEDSDAVKKLARSLDEKTPKILVSRKTGAIEDFVSSGFSIHSGDYTARKVAVASYIVTFVCFCIGTFMSKSLLTGLLCATGAAAFMAPLSQTLVTAVPSALMQKSLEKVGALVNGWKGIDQLSKTTHVNFDAKHLFPKGTVILHGIKTFEKERIDLAIMYAASVLVKECETLRPLFMDVIEGKTDILYPVENCEYIQCGGYVAWVEKNRVIIGNRSLMEKYDVAMPPVSIETVFIKQGRKPVYLAVGGKLFGMFAVSYHPDETVKENLDKLIERDVNIILSSTDFNIDPALIEQVYGVPVDRITVLNQKETALLSGFTSYVDKTDACVAHLDSLTSLVAAFCGAESARSAEKFCEILQAICVLIGAVLSVLFTVSLTLPYISVLSMLLLNFGFMGITMIGAFIKKY